MRSVVSVVLFLFPIHLLFIKIKNYLYDKNILSPTRVGATVISVGNISLGGTGKTPFTIALSNFLVQRGKSVGVLTRGYGRKGRGDFLLKKHSVEEAGDEAIVLRNNLSKSVPIYISKNKVLGAKKLIDLGCDIIVLDDAFQHRRVHRDLDIVLLSARELAPSIAFYKPEWHRSTFPYGLLREPFHNLNRADLFIGTKLEQYSYRGMAETAYDPDTDPQMRTVAKVLDSYYEWQEGRFELPFFWHDMRFKQTLLSSDKNEKITIKELIRNHLGPEYFIVPGDKKSPADRDVVGIMSICAIGEPEQFESSLVQLGFPFGVNRKTFPDHHSFTKKDISDIVDMIKKRDIQSIICTEKDWVKLVRFKKEIGVPIYAVRLDHYLKKDIQDAVLCLL